MLSLLQAGIASADWRPNIEISIEQEIDGAIRYHPVAPKTADDVATAQVYLVISIRNKGTETIELKGIVLDHAGGTQTYEVVGLPGGYSCGSPSRLAPRSGTPGPCTLKPGQVRAWDNPREYWKDGDVLYLTQPVPPTLTLRLRFLSSGRGAGSKSAVFSRRYALKAAPVSFGMPLKASDLRKHEFITARSQHGGGVQVFHYDIGAAGWSDTCAPGRRESGNWCKVLPGTDGTKNEHYRVFGKPVYAVADGEVIAFYNDCPSQPKMEQNDCAVAQKALDEAKTDQKKALAKKALDGCSYAKCGSCKGCGNHFAIRHAGGLSSWYMHMQRSSLNPSLLRKGAKVKRGETLGKVGNSGSSTAPHLHFGINQQPKLDVFGYSIFDEGYAIAQQTYSTPGASTRWSKMTRTGIAAVPSFVWPSTVHPSCAYPTNRAQVSRHGIPESAYQAEFDKAATCGYAPAWVDGYDVQGSTYFNVIFTKSSAPWFARHNMSASEYQAEIDKWRRRAGYQLLVADSYLRGKSVKYVAVWTKGALPARTAYHGATATVHQSSFDRLSRTGWTPVSISVVAPEGKPQFTAIYERANRRGFHAHPAMTPSEYRTLLSKHHREGFKLVYLNAHSQGGRPRLSGIWYRVTPFGGTLAKSRLTASAYQREVDAHSRAGYLLRAVTAYDDGGVARFEGLWAR
jgi:hypothetical protein